MLGSTKLFDIYLEGEIYLSLYILNLQPQFALSSLSREEPDNESGWLLLYSSPLVDTSQLEMLCHLHNMDKTAFSL